MKTRKNKHSSRSRQQSSHRRQQSSHSQWLPVGDGHLIHFLETGSPSGKPVVVLHGGPGGGIQYDVLQFFDLSKWRVILFDQRGCGKSLFQSNSNRRTDHNTTWDLVSDMEKLRKHLQIDSWTVFGGSWGSTLALAYASKHMNRCAGFVLRGISLLEPWENNWLYTPGGAARLFPEEWSKFAKFGTSLREYSRALNSRNRQTRRRAARAWYSWESALSSLDSVPSSHPSDSDATVEAIAQLEHHYFSHGGWLRKGQLLNTARRIPRTIPVRIVQGRYDMVCPAWSAVQLARAISHAHVQITVAGHSAFDAGNASALKKAVASLISD